MYRAHSKDINRNKSFHPLTYGNLRRIELLKEDAEEKNQRAAERQKELQRDQEERRYDALVLANSADSLSGELARFRQTKNIFKAEYEVDSATRQTQSNGEAAEKSASSSPAPLSTSSSLSSAPSNAFLSKFKREGNGLAQSTAETLSTSASKTEVKAEPSSAVAGGPPGKRPRVEEDGGSGEKREEGGSRTGGSATATTGFVTSVEAAQLRKELNRAQKQRHDPLLRVQQYQNSCVASVARQQQQEAQQHQQLQQQSDVGASRHGKPGTASTTPKDNGDALQSRIRELLELKKRKK